MARKSQRLRRQRRIERAKASEQEAKLSQAIEDNSAILERMKSMSSSIDKALQTLDTENETKSEETVTPKPVVEMKAEPSVEMRIQPYNEPTLIAPEAPNLKKMTKRALLSYAKENDIVVRSSMTKKQILKTIEES